MISKLKLENILFLDIETVPQAISFDTLDNTTKTLYADKTKYLRNVYL